MQPFYLILKQQKSVGCYHKKINISALGSLSCSGGDPPMNALTDTFEVFVVVSFLSKIF